MNYIMLWLIVRLLAGFVGITYGCNEGWTLFPRLKLCYRVMQPPLTCEQARASCSSHKANMVKLGDWDEQRFLSAEFLGSVKAHGVWIGATDRVIPHYWEWFDGSIFNTALYKWIPGNPDNNRAVLSNIADSEDCIEIAAYSNNVRGLLNDYKCDIRLPYICEMKDTESDVKSSDIPTSPLHRNISTTPTTSQRTVVPSTATQRSAVPSTTPQRNTIPSTNFQQNISIVTTHQPNPTVNQTFVWILCVSIPVGLIVTIVVVCIIWRQKRHIQKNKNKETHTMPRNMSVHLYSEIGNITTQTNETSLVEADCITNNYEDTLSVNRNITEHQYTELSDSTKEISKQAKGNTDRVNNYEDTLSVNRNITEHQYTELSDSTKETSKQAKGNTDCVNNYEDTLSVNQNIAEHQYTELSDSTKEISKQAKGNTDCVNNYECTLAIHRDNSENMYSKLENIINHNNEAPVKKSDSIAEQYEKIRIESRTIPEYMYSALENPSNESSDCHAKISELQPFTPEDTILDKNRSSTGSAYCEVLAAGKAITVYQKPNSDASEYVNTKLN